ncbi:hypothetical protein D9M72_492010 [compost metagenome]
MGRAVQPARPGSQRRQCRGLVLLRDEAGKAGGGRGVGTDRGAARYPFARQCRAHQPGEPGAAEHQAEARAWKSNAAVAVHPALLACRHQVRAGANGPAAHERYRGEGGRVHGLEQQLDTDEARQQRVIAFAFQVAKVEAGAEMRAASREREQARTVAIAGLHSVCQGRHQAGGQRIAALRPGQRQRGHVAVLFHPQPVRRAGAPGYLSGAHAAGAAQRLGTNALA